MSFWVGRGVEVMNPYEWLPPYGETSVELRTEGTDLIVAIAYDCDVGMCVRELRFNSVCWFHSQVFPGPSMLGIGEDDVELLLRGALIEYPDSEAAMAWRKYFEYSRDIRHYSIGFMATNIKLTVLAVSAA
ncbi:hypothetical protein [Cupriavidus pampae]|uniref:hypothetical protein n=1 Tax=Cupriavidus pampae TaxID=659251 RepID=UPI001CC43F67|nr:hypothetical protein [Cupriavidus pampae]